jgi:hypothetical protein
MLKLQDEMSSDSSVGVNTGRVLSGLFEQFNCCRLVKCSIPDKFKIFFPEQFMEVAPVTKGWEVSS